MKKTRNDLVCKCVAVAMVLGCMNSANAAVVYDNGPINGTAGNAVAISGGWDTSTSFTLSGATTFTGAQVALWATMGETPVSLAWSIGTTAFGSEVASGVAALSNTFVMDFIAFPTSYSIYESQFALSGTAGAGTYWVTLSNGLATAGSLDWDTNFGPSASATRNLGLGIAPINVPSQSFQVFGDPVAAVPEPASLAIWGLGGIGMAVAARRKRKQVA
ncbi:MAG: PEP-CTERM sorting domain-containing protein [Planctomycetes bacterium]|nr:PEP-CTERM sorting domain-containing protein [Planctomycetota bacterium]